jgi:K+-sensing histidine kinase KdpD
VLAQHQPLQPSETRPTTRSVLARCVASTSLEWAFLVTPARRRGSGTPSILAHYPDDASQVLPFSGPVRGMIQEAIDAAYTVTVSRSVARRQQEWPKGGLVEALIATPVVLSTGQVWGALVALGHNAAISPGTVGVLEQLAQQLAAILCGDVEALAREDAMRLPWDEQPLLPCGRLHDVLLHELRAPLAAACYSLEALACDEAVERNAGLAKRIHTVQLGVEGAQRVIRWCSQLEAISGGALPLHPEAVAVAETMRHAKELLPAAPLSFDWALAEPDLAVLADQIWLTQVCINLLDNAFKHAPRTSDVRVEVSRQAVNRVLTMVTTMGTGMPIDRLQTLFRPYGHEGASADLTSRGLGLAIAHYCVVQMGGEMWANSDGHSYTSVAFVLPSVDSGAQQT